MQGSQEGWIEMMKCVYTIEEQKVTCWEANVVPGYEITKLRANGTVTACYNTSSTVNGSYLVGGVVGQNNKGIVTACYNASGSIYGEVTIGGVVGENYTGTVTACYWSNYAGYGIGNGTGDATKVDSTDVTWAYAVNTMNNALNGSGWQYELTGALPTLKKQ